MTINRDALVEKAAHAIIDAEYPDIAWRLIQGKARELRLQQARAALDAILPDVQTQTLEDAVDELAREQYETYGCVLPDVDSALDQLRERAAEYQKVASDG